jgi:hypothetical protein
MIKYVNILKNGGNWWRVASKRFLAAALCLLRRCEKNRLPEDAGALTLFLFFLFCFLLNTLFVAFTAAKAGKCNGSNAGDQYHSDQDFFHTV